MLYVDHWMLVKHVRFVGHQFREGLYERGANVWVSAVLDATSTITKIAAIAARIAMRAVVLGPAPVTGSPRPAGSQRDVPRTPR